MCSVFCNHACLVLFSLTVFVVKQNKLHVQVSVCVCVCVLLVIIMQTVFDTLPPSLPPSLPLSLSLSGVQVSSTAVRTWVLSVSRHYAQICIAESFGLRRGPTLPFWREAYTAFTRECNVITYCIGII